MARFEVYESLSLTCDVLPMGCSSAALMCRWRCSGCTPFVLTVDDRALVGARPPRGPQPSSSISKHGACRVLQSPLDELDGTQIARNDQCSRSRSYIIHGYHQDVYLTPALDNECLSALLHGCHSSNEKILCCVPSSLHSWDQGTATKRSRLF